jgi:hypothetical protein
LRCNPAAGGTAEKILAEVLARGGSDDRGDRELVREAVEDAIARRRPRW